MQIKTAAEIKILSSWPCPAPLGLRSFRLALKAAWKDHFGCDCQSCGRRMDFKNGEARNYATIDHIKAKCFGGSDYLSNLQIICRKCNNEKSKKEGLGIQA